MNDKPSFSQSEREALKCLTEGKAPFLKELLSEDTLVNVSLSPTDLEGNASLLSFVCVCCLFCFSSVIHFI